MTAFAAEIIQATERSAVRTAFQRRYSVIVDYLASTVDEETLAEALAVADPYSGLSIALARAVTLKEPRDPLAAARARGTANRERLIDHAGGLLRVADVAALLEVSSQAVQARRSRGTILAVPVANGEWKYPACQFDGAALLPGLGEVLGSFREVDPWQQLNVLLGKSSRFGGRTALDLLRDGDVAAARSIAATYEEQG